MNFKTYSDLSADIKRNISKISNMQFDLIVGIPRSGMIPAYMIALFLNVNVIDLNGFIENHPIQNGATRGTKGNLNFPHEAKKILLIDDSILSGKTFAHNINKIPSELMSKITSLAIYSSTLYRNDIDLFFEYLPLYRMFEWNIFHHPMLSKSCVDIDGVLCIDPTEDENDDGDKYRAFLLNATPLFLPSTKIHSLVTSRLEKYRLETEQWLEKHNIRYDNLIMLDLPSKEERIKLNAHSEHKSNYYKKSKTILFIESDIGQAQQICQQTGRDVYCTKNNQLYSPDTMVIITKNPTRIITKLIFLGKKIIKKLIKYSRNITGIYS